MQTADGLAVCFAITTQLLFSDTQQNIQKYSARTHAGKHTHRPQNVASLAAPHKDTVHACLCLSYYFQKKQRLFACAASTGSLHS
jgi:hypothetical protein